MGTAPKIVCVPKEQWPQIRHDYLETHQPEATAQPATPAKPAVVDQAQQLFGDLVEVKTD